MSDLIIGSTVELYLMVNLQSPKWKVIWRDINVTPLWSMAWKFDTMSVVQEHAQLV